MATSLSADNEARIFRMLQEPCSRILKHSSLSKTNAKQLGQDLYSLFNLLEHTTLSDQGSVSPSLSSSSWSPTLSTEIIIYLKYVLVNHTYRQLCQRFRDPVCRFDFVVEPWLKCIIFLLKLPTGYTSLLGQPLVQPTERQWAEATKEQVLMLKVQAWRMASELIDTMLMMADGFPVATSANKKQGEAQNGSVPIAEKTTTTTAIIRPTTTGANAKALPSAPSYSTVQKDRLSDDARLAALDCLMSMFSFDSPSATTESRFGRQDTLLIDNYTTTAMPGNNGSNNNDNIRNSSSTSNSHPYPDDTLINNLRSPQGQSQVARIIDIIIGLPLTATVVAIRLKSLQVLDLFLRRCLYEAKSVALWTPGVLQGLGKIILEKGRDEHSTVKAKALEVIGFVIGLVSKDQHTATALTSNASMDINAETLMALASSIQSNPATSTSPLSPSPSSSSSSSSVGSTLQSGYGSAGWKLMMRKGCKILFDQISFLQNDDHWQVRLKFATISFDLLKACRVNLGRGLDKFLLEILIGGAQDEFKQVAVPVTEYLKVLVFGSKTSTKGRQEDNMNTVRERQVALQSIAQESLQEKLVAFPRIMHGYDEKAKQDSIRLVRGLILFLGSRCIKMMITNNSVISESSSSRFQLWDHLNSFQEMLMLDHLESYGVESGQNQEGVYGLILVTMSSPVSENVLKTHPILLEAQRWPEWVASQSTLTGHGENGDKSAKAKTDVKFGFPRKVYRFLQESSTASLFLKFVRQFGAVVDVNMVAEEVLTTLQGRQESSNSWQDDAYSDVNVIDQGISPLILMLNHLLLGASHVGMSESSFEQEEENKSKQGKKKATKHPTKRVREVAKSALGEYLVILNHVKETLAVSSVSRTVPDGAHIGNDRRPRSSASSLAPASEFAAADSSTQSYNLHQFVMVQCLAFEGIATIAVLLGPDFESELLHVLYPLLEALSDPDSFLVRDSALAALGHVSFACGYASIGDLIQANYDYVIHQISTRIGLLVQNKSAPQVLWSLIRIVGAPAVNMLEDSVTEIFEALNRCVVEGLKQEEIAVGLMKALNEIVRVMAPPAPLLTTTDDDQQKQKSESQDLADKASILSVSDPAKPSPEVLTFAKDYRRLVRGADLLAEDEELKAKKSPAEVRDYFKTLAGKSLKEQHTRGATVEEIDEEEDLDLNDTEKSLLDDDQDVDIQGLMAKLQQAGESKSKKTSGDEAHDEAQSGSSTLTEPPPLSKQQKLLLTIVRKAGYMLPSGSFRIRLFALEIIRGSIQVMESAVASGQTTDFYQELHGLWPSIVQRLKTDPEWTVRMKAMEVITSLSESAHAFLKRNLEQDVWPLIIAVLKGWAITTKKEFLQQEQQQLARSKATARATLSSSLSTATPKTAPLASKRRIFTRDHQFQVSALKSLTRIMAKVTISLEDCWDLILLTKEFLDPALYPEEICEAARELMDVISSGVHADAAWLATQDW